MSDLRLDIRNPDVFIIGKYGENWRRFSARPWVVIPLKQKWINYSTGTIACPNGITLHKKGSRLIAKVDDGTLDVFSIKTIAYRGQSGGGPKYYVIGKDEETATYSVRNDVPLKWNGRWTVDESTNPYFVIQINDENGVYTNIQSDISLKWDQHNSLWVESTNASFDAIPDCDYDESKEMKKTDFARAYYIATSIRENTDFEKAVNTVGVKKVDEIYKLKNSVASVYKNGQGKLYPVKVLRLLSSRFGPRIGTLSAILYLFWGNVDGTDVAITKDVNVKIPTELFYYFDVTEKSKHLEIITDKPFVASSDNGLYGFKHTEKTTTRFGWNDDNESELSILPQGSLAYKWVIDQGGYVVLEHVKHIGLVKENNKPKYTRQDEEYLLNVIQPQYNALCGLLGPPMSTNATYNYMHGETYAHIWQSKVDRNLWKLYKGKWNMVGTQYYVDKDLFPRFCKFHLLVPIAKEFTDLGDAFQKSEITNDVVVKDGIVSLKQ